MDKIEDKYFKALADHFINLIEEKGLDVADIAAAANVNRKQIYRLINKENIPKLSTLIKIGLATGIEPNILFDFKFDYKKYMLESGIYTAIKKTKKDA